MGILLIVMGRISGFVVCMCISRLYCCLGCRLKVMVGVWFVSCVGLDWCVWVCCSILFFWVRYRLVFSELQLRLIIQDVCCVLCVMMGICSYMVVLCMFSELLGCIGCLNLFRWFNMFLIESWQVGLVWSVMVFQVFIFGLLCVSIKGLFVCICLGNVVSISRYSIMFVML